MKKIKRFIVWVNYGLEGWSILGSSDDQDEAVFISSEAIDECNPHRAFHPDNKLGFFYKENPIQNHKEMRLGKTVLDIMTDGKLSDVKVPQRQDGK